MARIWFGGVKMPQNFPRGFLRPAGPVPPWETMSTHVRAYRAKYAHFWPGSGEHPAHVRDPASSGGEQSPTQATGFDWRPTQPHCAQLQFTHFLRQLLCVLLVLGERVFNLSWLRPDLLRRSLPCSCHQNLGLLPDLCPGYHCAVCCAVTGSSSMYHA